MIKKELLSAVLNEHIDRCDYKKELSFKNSIRYWNTPANTMPNVINIYELANLCKEWAFNLNYSISSCKRINGFNHVFFEALVQNFTYQSENIKHDYSEHLCYCIGDIEPEAIFKACEYILANKGNQND